MEKQIGMNEELHVKMYSFKTPLSVVSKNLTMLCY